MHKNKINNKKYIGITCMIPEKRWNNGKGYSYNEHFYRSILKYGWNEGFDHFILHKNLTKEEAEQKEIELIAKYDLTNQDKGYNIGIGGGIVESKTVYQYDRKTGLFLKEWENTIAIERALGIPNTHISAICLKKMKTSHGFYFSYNYLGEQLPNDIYNYINTNDCYKRIAQYNLDGKFVKEYESISNAEKVVKGTINMNSKISHGYIWKHITEENEYTYKEDLTNDYLISLNSTINNKKCYRYSKVGKFIDEFISTTEAAKKLNLNQSSIAACCRKEYKISGGYIWRYASEVEYGKDLDKDELKKDLVHRLSKSVKKYDKQGNFIKEFDSVTEAANEINVSTNNISLCCKRKSKSVKNFIYRYSNDDLTINEIQKIITHNKKRKVAQYTMDGKYIATYISLAEASRITGARDTSIRNCCVGKYKHANHFLWKYV